MKEFFEMIGTVILVILVMIVISAAIAAMHLLGWLLAPVVLAVFIYGCIKYGPED